MNAVRVTIDDRIYQQNSLVWTLSHNKLQPARTMRYVGTNHDVHRITGKFCALYCSEISLPSTDGRTQFCDGAIALRSDETPTWIFHHLLRPSTSVLRSLPAITLVARDGMMGEITFSFMTNMEINRHEEQLTLEGEANGPHWRYYFDHFPCPCLSLDIHTHRHL